MPYPAGHRAAVKKNDSAHGDQFTHFYSQQVVAELREGDYLK